MAIQQRKRVNISLLIPFLVIAIVFGTMLWQKYRDSRVAPVTLQKQPPAGKRTAVLFFVVDGTRLAREARELDRCEDTATCLNDVLAELLNGPVGEFDESLPEGTVFKSISIDNNLAVINMNDSFARALPSGSSAEMMAVYSVVNTVAANFPQITRVKLTVEGFDASHLSHLGLSAPLAPDYTLEQPPQSDPNVLPASTPSKPDKGKP